MTSRPWHLNRRELLYGGGVALALPMLQAMGMDTPAARAARPKRMLVSYFAYGAYMPGTEAGVAVKGSQTHHEWNWWPCPNPGPLTFNKSSEPFAPLKDQISYLRGLDHVGGW